MDTPERMAAEWVREGNGGVELGIPACSPVRLRRHPNPAVTADELAALRAFVADAIREALRRAAPPNLRTADAQMN